MDTDGNNFTIIHDFVVADGGYPDGNLLLYNGKLYGTTGEYGANSYGTIFSVDPNGDNFTVLHDFANGPDDGAYARAALTAYDGYLWGTTTYGGADNLGTVFRISPDGSSYTIVHDFEGGYEEFVEHHEK